MHTLNDQATRNPSLEVKLQDGPMKEILGDRVRILPPDGDNVEPTFLIDNQEYYEIDTTPLSPEQFRNLSRFYGGESGVLKEVFDECVIALLPSDWVGGVA